MKVTICNYTYSVEQSVQMKSPSEFRYFNVKLFPKLKEQTNYTSNEV